MNLICIQNSKRFKYGFEYYDNITIGKVYDILNYKNGHYWIWDDNANQRGIPTECFMSVEEWRDNQINKVLE
jgi:hypothetical protein